MEALAKREEEIRERIRKQDKIFVERASQNRELLKKWVRERFGD